MTEFDLYELFKWLIVKNLTNFTLITKLSPIMIKEILKNNSVTLSEFASLLNVARPTLDSYIKSYDCNGYINNQSVNNVFDFLFSDDAITNELFLEKYAYIKRLYTKKRTENSVDSISRSFLKERSGSALKAKVLNVISNNEFSDEVFNQILDIVDKRAKKYVLVKEIKEYALYHEETDGLYLLVFKSRSTNNLVCSEKINGLYHYVVFRTQSYDEMSHFIEENLEAN